MRFAFVAYVVLFAAMAVPSRADDVTPALIEAAKHLQQGAPAKALDIVNRTLKSGQIPADLASKALLLRARAHEALGKYAYALADYNQAVWMKGLSAGDKSEAEAGRTRIMAKLGVSDGDTPPAKPVKAAQVPQEQPAQRAGPQGKAAAWDTDVQTTASEQRTGGTGGLGGFFSGIFGSSSSEKAEPQPPQQAEIQPATRPLVQRVAVEPPARTVAAVQPRPKPEPQPVAEARVSQTTLSAGSGEPSGDFAIQIAAMHSEDRAIYEVNRVEKRFSELLGGRTPSITVRPTNDGGTLFKVIIEPYQRGEGVATCEMLKTKGLNCMLISR